MCRPERLLPIKKATSCSGAAAGRLRACASQAACSSPAASCSGAVVRSCTACGAAGGWAGWVGCGLLRLDNQHASTMGNEVCPHHH